jgi:hypothetical protein
MTLEASVNFNVSSSVVRSIWNALNAYVWHNFYNSATAPVFSSVYNSVRNSIHVSIHHVVDSCTHQKYMNDYDT